MQIAYLDNLNFGSYSTAQFVTPRVKYFTKEIIDRLTNMDKAHCRVGQEYKFGQTEVRVIMFSIPVMYRLMDITYKSGKASGGNNI